MKKGGVALIPFLRRFSFFLTLPTGQNGHSGLARVFRCAGHQRKINALNNAMAPTDTRTSQPVQDPIR